MSFDLNIQSFNEVTSERPNIYCKGFVPLLEGSPTMLSAGGGTGKSYASIRMACEYSLETNQKAALWLTEDTPGENKFRFNSICKEFYPRDKERLHSLVKVINRPPIKFTKFEKNNAAITHEFYKTRLTLIDFGMVVIDPLIQFNGCDENSNSQAGVLMGEIKTWASEEEKVIVLIHHITITQEGGVKARGAGEWSNACRAVYLVSKPEGSMDDGFLNFKLTKNNGIAWCFKNESGNLERVLKIFPPWETEKPKLQDKKLFISMAGHNNEKDPTGFLKVEVDNFYDIHKYLTDGVAYSQYEFKDFYRKGSNNSGSANIVFLDFDNGLTLEEAKKKFSPIQCCIITTKSHQVLKSGVKCDRFRVVIPLNKPLDIPLSEYPSFLNTLNEYVGGDVDPSTKDLARFYYSSPQDAYYWYSDSTRRMNWNVVYRVVKKKKAQEKIKKAMEKHEDKKEYQGEPNNTLPEDTLIETKNGYIPFNSLRDNLSVGEKVVCKCHERYDHGDLGSQHYSAFVQKSDNGNVFYSCSGGRCAHVGTLWCAGWK